MGPWVESLGVLILGALGALAGAWFSRVRWPWWLMGYLVALSLVLLYDAGTHFPYIGAVPPISWMLTCRKKYAIIGLIAAMALTTPLMKLPRRRDRWSVGALAACIVLFVSVWPFLAPAFNRTYLAGLVTSMDDNGICRQSTDYTCGPAAAVTALRKLGFAAEEGQIAIHAYTSSAIGTPPDILAETLQEHYGKQGLVAEYRVFGDINELKNAGLTLAVIKFNLLLDHYVTVLEVRDDVVVIGDPLSGLETMSRTEFAAKWRYEGVVLARR
jgi:Peptidase C39 family